MEFSTWNSFTENKAVNYGGAVYVKGNFYTNLGRGTSQEKEYDRIIGLRTILFDHTSVSEDDGGAVYCCGNAYINDAFFYGCSAKVDGGAVYCEGKTNITSSGFDQNKASGAKQRCFGGAVRSEGTCYIDSSLFTDNYAEDYGGAVYADDNIYISNDCYIYFNTAVNYGGAIYAEDNVYINWNMENTKMVLIGYNDVETDDGGGIYVEDNIFVNNAKFETCFAKIDGGAIYCKGKSTLVNSVFYDNNVIIEHSLHLNYGGAICSKGSCTVDSCSFDMNGAYDRGGAIYCYGQVSINNSRFHGNYAENYGGAVYADTIKTISNTMFGYNTAHTDDGGAVYINSKCTTTITGCNFNHNEAGDEGGAIYTDSAFGKMNLYSTIFVGNKAGDKGHAVYNSGEFGTVNGNWYGSNNPNFKSLLKIFHWVGSDSDYKDSHYAQIYIKINDTDIYMGNPYKVTVYFKNKDGKDITKEMHWYDVTFSGDGKFSNHKIGYNEVTTDVVFNNENPTVKAKMDDQVLELKLNAKSKAPSSVNITSCPDVYCPNALNVTFKIENRSNPTYAIKNSKGKIIKKGDVVGEESLSVEGLASGTYSITISNPASWLHLASSATAYFTVYPLINVEVSANNVSYGQNTTITLKNDMDGIYFMEIEDVGIYEVEVLDGMGVKELKLDAGEYHTTTTYSNANYTVVVSEARFVVKKSLIHMDVMFDEVCYPNDMTGVIITDVPGIYNIKNDTTDLGMFNVTESPYRFNLGGFAPGTYYISAFSTDPNYELAGVLAIVEVHPGELNMSLHIPDVVYGDDVIATVHSDAADTFMIQIGDFEREVDVRDDLNANVGSDWDVGTYNATLVFKGNEYYAPGTYNTSFEVLKDETPSTHKKLNAQLITPDRVIYVSQAVDGYEYSIILKDESGNAIADSDVVITFNNLTCTARTGSDGWLSVNLTANEAGAYEVKVDYRGDYEHNSASQAATVKVVKESVQFLAPDRAVYLNDMAKGYSYQAILKSKDGKALANRKVLVTFNGKKQVAFTDEKGYVTFNLTADKAGSYRVDLRFAGDRYYNELGSYRTIRVVKD